MAKPGATVAEVAPRHDVCTSLIYKWRRDAAPRAPVAFVLAKLVEALTGRRTVFAAALLAQPLSQGLKSRIGQKV